VCSGADDPGQRADGRGIVGAEVRLDAEHSQRAQAGLAVDGQTQITLFCEVAGLPKRDPAAPGGMSD